MYVRSLGDLINISEAILAERIQQWKHRSDSETAVNNSQESQSQSLSHVSRGRCEARLSLSSTSSIPFS